MVGLSVMPNSRLKIVRDEFLTSIDQYDEFHVNLLFNRSIYRPMCTHMGNRTFLALSYWMTDKFTQLGPVQGTQ